MGDYPAQNPFQVEPALAGRLAAAKEAVWFRIGVLQSAMNDRERALEAFERVLAVNPSNVRAMTQAGAVLAKKECYPQAVAYLQRAISSDSSCGEAWAVLAHCYVMTDDLQKAYQAYQSALSHLPNPRDPNLWYGIGLLYDRYGSLDNALEAFLAVLSISPDFERADEVCFCIGIIYKEQQNFDEALKYFNKVVVAANPPPPLTRADGWYQIGHVNELKRDIPVALEMYKHALAENPKHPKTLQNFGWLEHQHNNNSNEAIRLLKMSAELDPSDGQTWYLLGRVYMALREFRQAYDAYQQAVYRDGRNATFWCSIGVLYYQMNQYRDAMDAYSRAIRLNPYVSEVWYDLGTLYESCGQNADAIDAYRRAAELAPENTQITQRLAVLENSMNPGAHPQQATPQSQHSAQQNQAQQMPPPQQMQPDMHHASQQHMQPMSSVVNRPMAPSLQQLGQPLTQQKLPHHQPPLPSTQLPGTQPGAHPTSMAQQVGGQNGSAISGPQRSGQMELSALASLRTQNLPPGQGIGQNGAFSQDARPSLTGSLPRTQLGAHSAGMNHVAPLMSQPLNTQPHSSMLPPPTMSSAQQDSHPGYRRPDDSPHAQLPNLVRHQGSPGAPAPRHHQQLGPPENQQQGQHPSVPVSHLSPQQPPLQASVAQNDRQSEVQHPHHPPPPPPPPQPQPKVHASPQGSPQDAQQPAQPPSQPQQQPPHSQQQSSHSQGHSTEPPVQTHSNALPHVQALPQLPSLPQMPQQPPDAKRPEPEQRPGNGPDSQRLAATNEHKIGRDRYMQPQGEPLRQQDFPRSDERHEPRLPKVGKVNEQDAAVGYQGPESAMTSQPMYSSSLPIPVSSQAGNVIPPIREPAPEPPAPGPLPSRQMSMHEITQPDSQAPPRRLEDSNRNEGDQGDRSRNDSQAPALHRSPEKVQIPERLPAVSSLPGPIQGANAHRDPGEDARLLTSVGAPPLPMPPASSAPPHGSSEGPQPITPHSSADGPSTAGLGSGAPPLPPMSSRSSSLGGLGPDNKDAPPIGSAPMGVSSLTKFGKGLVRPPATPVNSSVAPSSLPSPLPSRKGSSTSVVTHGARSPRISKPSSTPSFKSVPIPQSTANPVGQIESVPSPSSLPVLPALSSHATTENEKPVKEKKSEPEPARDGVSSDTRLPGPKHDERNAKENSSGRKNDDALANKPIFGVLRSAPAPVQTPDVNRSENEEKVKSPVQSSSQRQDSDNASSLKREGPAKDESGRTAKRPRLHDLHDGEEQKSYGYNSEEKQQKPTNKTESETKENEALKGGQQSGGKPEIPSYKDIKADLRASNSGPGGDSSENKEEGQNRSGEVDGGKSMGMGAQVIDLPRLSAPLSRSGTSLPGNTPLPSFRSERMKSSGQDSSSRSSLPFALRSAPVTPLAAPLKPHMGPGGRAVERDYASGQNVEEPVVKRVTEDKGEGGGVGGSSLRDGVMSDRVANGDTTKGSGSGEVEGRGASENNRKEEKQTGRTEIHSSAT